MPRGGARPNSGPKKGSHFRRTIGREAPVPDFRSLEEMRLAATLLRNIMVTEHDKMLAGADNLQLVRDCIKGLHQSAREDRAL
jgi:hypothetical protein